MEKDFDGWNTKKKRVEIDARKTLFREGEIWWCAVGVNVGQESCGKGNLYRRPILIIKKLSRENCIGLPVSTKQKSGSWFVEISVRKVKEKLELLLKLSSSSPRR